MVQPWEAILAKASPSGNGRAARHAGDDNGLRYIGQSILRVEGRGGAGEGGHAGGHVVGHAHLVQLIHLLPDGAVEGGVAGVEPDGGLALPLGLLHDGEHLLQGHGRAVVHGAALLAALQQGRVHQGTGIDDHVGLSQQPGAPQGDEIRCAGTGADKVYHISEPPFFVIYHVPPGGAPAAAPHRGSVPKCQTGWRRRGPRSPCPPPPGP